MTIYRKYLLFLLDKLLICLFKLTHIPWFDMWEFLFDIFYIQVKINVIPLFFIKLDYKSIFLNYS